MNKLNTIVANSSILIVSLVLLFNTDYTSIDSNKEVINTTEYNNDTFYLAAIINAECGICNETEKILVASTVLNRAKEQQVILEPIIFQRHQYEGVKSKHFYCTDSSFKLAKSIMNGEVKSYPKIKYFVTHGVYENSFAKEMKKDIIIQGYYHKYF